MYVEALKDFERQDLVRQPCSAASASSVAVEEAPSVSRSDVGVFALYLNKRTFKCIHQWVSVFFIHLDAGTLVKEDSGMVSRELARICSEVRVI